MSHDAKMDNDAFARLMQARIRGEEYLPSPQTLGEQLGHEAFDAMRLTAASFIKAVLGLEPTTSLPPSPWWSRGGARYEARITPGSAALLGAYENSIVEPQAKGDFVFRDPAQRSAVAIGRDENPGASSGLTMFVEDRVVVALNIPTLHNLLNGRRMYWGVSEKQNQKNMRVQKRATELATKLAVIAMNASDFATGASLVAIQCPLNIRNQVQNALEDMASTHERAKFASEVQIGVHTLMEERGSVALRVGHLARGEARSGVFNIEVV